MTIEYDLDLDLHQLNSLPSNTSDEVAASTALVIQIRTRHGSLSLHNKSGNEENVARSIAALVEEGREVLRAHPLARRTAAVFFSVLELLLVPRTSRWQRAIAKGRFRSADYCRRFRTDLSELQPALVRVVRLFEAIQEGRQLEVDDLFMGVPLSARGYPRIRSHQSLRSTPVSLPGDYDTDGKVLKREQEAIVQPGADFNDGTGLAISGGGIRSATFALGVVGVLVRRGLFHQFDYLSTVSGGGYLGTFLSSVLHDQENRINDIFVLGSQKDSPAVRHLRNNSKYLFNKLSDLLRKRSVQKYYRQKLCECYLVQMANEQMHQRDSLKLISLGGDRKKASRGEENYVPYHLINTTVNLPDSLNPELRWRGADFFVISRHWCGGMATRLVETEKLVDAEPDLDLGTAMAISGAAFSSNMGVMSRRVLRPIGAFGPGLGYNIPNIFLNQDQEADNASERQAGNTSDGQTGGRLRRWGRSAARKFRQALHGFKKARHKFREATGSLDESGAFLNLSDGGHIENLGVFELLRRQCKYIVCIDGECDRDLFFDGLIKLVNYARIDLGIEIVIDPAELAKNEDDFSDTHHLLGKILYDEGHIGWLLYLKLSLTGDETPDVLDYQRVHPDFPHQTTADQIYDERQFEAYRKLGEHAAEGVFQSTILNGISPVFNAKSIRGETDLSRWFECLIRTQLPDNDSVFRNDPVSLESLQVGISSSNSPEHDDEDVNEAVRDLCRSLIGQGATVVLGQIWLPGGIMHSVAEIAQEDYLLNNRDDKHKPIINIFSTKHAVPRFPDEEMEQLIEIEQVDDYRTELNARCNVRICLGGQFSSGDGGIPGVLREAWLAAESGQFVIVSQCLGGISAWMARGLLSIEDAQPPEHYPDPGSLGMPQDPIDILRAIDANVRPELRNLYERLLRSTQFDATHVLIPELLEQWNS